MKTKLKMIAVMVAVCSVSAVSNQANAQRVSATISVGYPHRAHCAPPRVHTVTRVHHVYAVRPVRRVYVSRPVRTVYVSRPVRKVYVSRPVQRIYVTRPVQRVYVSRPVRHVYPVYARQSYIAHYGGYSRYNDRQEQHYSRPDYDRYDNHREQWGRRQAWERRMQYRNEYHNGSYCR